MKRFICFGLLAACLPLGLVSCAKHDERKVVGPSTGTSRIPWNQPVSGQGAGQLGMMQQNMHRR